MHFWAQRCSSVFKQVPESTPERALSFQKAAPTARLALIARSETAPNSDGPPNLLGPAGRPGSDSSPRDAGAPGAGTAIRAYTGSICCGPALLPSPPDHTLQKVETPYSPLKSSSRTKSGSRAQSRSPRRRFSAMSRGAEGPRTSGTARIPRAHARSLPGPCYPPLVTMATTWPGRAVTVVTKEADMVTMDAGMPWTQTHRVGLYQ